MNPGIIISVKSVIWLLITISYVQPLHGKLAVSVASLEREAKTKTASTSVPISPVFRRQGPREQVPSSVHEVMKKGTFQTYLSTGSAGRDDRYKQWPLERVKFHHPVQSPVDLVTSKAVTMHNLPPLDIIETIKDLNIQAKLYNSGQTVFVYINEDPSKRPSLVGGPLLERTFIFEQMHFHWGSEDIWGSEHFINGESYAVEIHLVHYNSSYGTFEEALEKPDGLSVLTIFAEAQDEDNPLLEPLHQLLPSISEAKTSVMLDALDAMKWAGSAFEINKDYYAYPGSLTTPPHSPNVIFILLPTPIKISLNQLSSFRSMHSDNDHFILDNKRNLQPLHNRPIVRGTRLVP